MRALAVGLLTGATLAIAHCAPPRPVADVSPGAPPNPAVVSQHQMTLLQEYYVLPPSNPATVPQRQMALIRERYGPGPYTDEQVRAMLTAGLITSLQARWLGVPIAAGQAMAGPGAPASAGPGQCGAAPIRARIGGTDALSAYRADCRPGESVLIPANQAGLIADVCDLSRSVVHSGDFVVCAMASPPGSPASAPAGRSAPR